MARRFFPAPPLPPSSYTFSRLPPPPPRLESQFELLPHEIRRRISKHLSASSNAALRLSNRNLYYGSWDGFDWEKECCREPSSVEIANWLYRQSYLLKYENTYRDSVLKPIQPKYSSKPHTQEMFNKIASQITIRFSNKHFDISENRGTHIDLDLNTGELTGELIHRLPFSGIFRDKIKLDTYPKILSYIADRQLNLDFASFSSGNWIIIRDILNNRISCKTYGVGGDTCFIRVLAKHLPTIKGTNNRQWVILLGDFYRYLGPLAQTRLEQDFIRHFNIEEPFSLQTYAIYLPDLDTNQFNLWFRKWILDLKPEDLILDPYINTDVVNYS